MNRLVKKEFSLIILLITTFALYGQEFPCDNGEKLYFFRGNETSNASTLSYIENYTTGTPTVVDMCPMKSSQHNGLGANSLDNYLYFLDNEVLTRLSSTCVETPVCSLGYISYYGAFDSQGRYWTIKNNQQISAIDINTCAVVKGPFPEVNYGGLDMAISPYDCGLYIGPARYDTTGVLDTTVTVKGFKPSGAYGGVAFGNDGKLYAIKGSGKSGNLSVMDYATNISNNVFDFVPGPAQFVSDMASFSCFPTDTVNADFDIFPSVFQCAPVTVNFNNKSTGNVPDSTLTYKWNFGDPTSEQEDTSSSKNPTHIYKKPGTYTVLLTSSYSKLDYCKLNASKDTMSLTFTIPSSSTGTISNDTSVCSGQSAQISASGLQNYTWTPSATLSCSNCPNPFASPTSSTTYYLSANDISGCAFFDSVLVEISNQNFKITPDTFVCQGDSVTLTASGGLSYTWNSGNSTPSITTTTNSSTPFTVTISDGQCTAVLSTSITLVPPFLTPITDTSICQGESLTLSTSGADSYWWIGTNQTNASITVTPLNDSLFTVVGTNTLYGCTDTARAKVTVRENPKVTSSDVKVCEGEKVTLHATGANDFVWNPGNITGDSLTITPLNTTIYLLKGTNLNGCSDTTKVVVSVDQNPNVDFQINPEKAKVNDPVFFTAETEDSTIYKWSFGDGYLSNETIISHRYEDVGDYTVCLFSKNNKECADSLCEKITIEADWVLYAPNTFTPNDDYSNDVFYVKGFNINQLQLNIYTRWGNLVFSSDQPEKGWNGKIKDAYLVQQDVYLWQLSFIDSYGKTHDQTGHITVYY